MIHVLIFFILILLCALFFAVSFMLGFFFCKKKIQTERAEPQEKRKEAIRSEKEIKDREKAVKFFNNMLTYDGEEQEDIML